MPGENGYIDEVEQVKKEEMRQAAKPVSKAGNTFCVLYCTSKHITISCDIKIM